MEEITTTWVVAQATAVVLILIIGTLGNGIVLIIYRKDKKLAGAIYIILLAVIDLVSCVVVLPQFPLYGIFLWHVA